MSETIKPALSPQEWARGVVHRRPGGPLASNGRDGVDLGSEHDGATFRGADRHAAAALCLHGQPFGFTWEDVDALRNEWENEWRGVTRPNSGDALLSLADRIAALLPPRRP